MKSINTILHVVLQIVNLHTNKVSRILGKVENNERFLKIALYQGDKGNKKVRKIPSVAANVNDAKEPLSDPTLLCCAFKKHRIYLFRYAIQSSLEGFSLAGFIVLHWLALWFCIVNSSSKICSICCFCITWCCLCILLLYQS